MKHPIEAPSPNASCHHSTGAGGDPRLERAIQFFHQRFAARVTMKEAARVACLSPKHFVEVFRSAVGCTPYQYLLQCRLRHARQMIASEGHQRPLAEIAVETGFFDQAHLTRHFQRAFGQSPGQWRQQTRSCDRERVRVLCKTRLDFPGFVQDARLTIRSN